MSKKPAALSFDRIAIAFATAEPPRSSLVSIAQLAAGDNAEISGVFIEDSDMLRAASLPFALEVCRATNVVRRVDPGEIEYGLRERALAARNQVADAARKSGARWSFQVVRKRTATAVLDLAGKSDLTIISTANPLRFRGQTMLRQAKLTGGSDSAGESIVVVVDRTAASGRAILLAHKLAEMYKLPVHAMVVAASRESLERLTDKLHRTDNLDASQIHGLHSPKFSDIISAMHAWRPAAAVLPFALVKGSSERIHGLEKAVDKPILIVK